MRTFFAAGVLLWIGGCSLSQAAEPGREISCRYLAQVQHLPQEARTIHVWVPLAKSGREQNIFRRDVHVPVAYTIAQDLRYGNDILHLVLTPPIPDHLEIAIDYQARLRGADAPADSVPTPESLRQNLQPSGLVIIDDQVRARAKAATTGNRTPLSRARGIYDYVRQFMTYDKTTPGWGRGDTRRACRVGKGNCTDFHSLFISMARASQIPARFKIGFVVPPESSGVIPGYHCWAEFYEDGKGWVPVDASEAWKHPERADYYFGAYELKRFLVSVGRDIHLVPPQRSDPVNIFFSPYVEVDGQPFSKVNVEVRMTALEPGRKT